MDILSVRKKAQAAREASARAQAETTAAPPTTAAAPMTAAPAPATTTLPAPSTTTLPAPATTTLPAPATTTLPAPATTTLPAPATTTLPAPATTTPPAPATTTLPAPAAPRRETSLPSVVDPLAGFLAADDVDAGEGDDVRHDDVAEQGQRYLAFRIGAEEYAATIMDIKEILPVRSVTEVPRAPRDVLGVVSRRGVVLPLVDLGASLGLRDADRTSRPQQRVLVAGDGDRSCGLRVDAVSEVVRLLPAAIEPVPASLGPRNAGLLIGLGRVGGRLFILLDVPAVLDALASSVGLPAQPRTERLP
jgi:purine-binding chemotaxis protein CheW